MADDGVSISLDDYIKVKRIGGRKGAGGAKFAVKGKQGRKGKAVVVAAGRRQRQRQGQSQQGQRFGRFPAQAGLQGQRKKNKKFGFGVGGRNRGFGLGGARQQQPGRSVVFKRARGRQDLNSVGRRSVKVQRYFSGRVSRDPQQVPRAGGRGIRARGVVRFAKKRVQRARLQLANQRTRVVNRPNRVLSRARLQSVMPLMSVTSGIRRTRNGFVTVSNPLDKQLQRLAVKEKIARAREIRNRALNPGHGHGQYASRPQRGAPRPQGVYEPPQRQRSRPRQRQNNGFNNRAMAIMANNNRGQGRAALNQAPRGEAFGYGSMYADLERQPVHLGRPDSHRSQWTYPQNPLPSPPLNYTRTTVNTMYDPRNPAITYEEDDYLAPALNPEIQKKISFIQSQATRFGQRDPKPETDQNFRGPVPIASSSMKLGDRFKMYMH